MNLHQLNEELGFDGRTFLSREPEEGDEYVTVYYPNYMDSEKFSTKPRTKLEVLKSMEQMIVNHRTLVNIDLKIIRAKIREIESELNS